MEKEKKSPAESKNTRQVWSNLLNANLDVPVQALNLDGRDVTIIPHDALKNIIHNKLPDRGVKYDVSFDAVAPTHCVARCVMADKEGRRVQEIGESTSDTLDTAIAKGYPATMAFQRAFDRAAIAYLDLSGKVFADTEGVSAETTDNSIGTETIDTAEIDSVEDEAPAMNKPEEASNAHAGASNENGEVVTPKASSAKSTSAKGAKLQKEKNANEAHPTESETKAPPQKDDKKTDVTPRVKPADKEKAIETPAADSGATTPESSVDNETESKPAAPASTDNVELDVSALGKTLIHIGRIYRTAPKSIAAVYEENYPYFMWIASEKFTALNESDKAEKELCRKYLQLRGEKK